MKRTITGRDIAAGTQTVHKMQAKVLQAAPHKFGPLAALQPQAGEEEQPELLKAHCLGCASKKEFAVEGEEKMKNGATRKYGKCTGGCGRTISTFVSGAQDAA